MVTVEPHLSLKERQRQQREVLILQAAEEIFTEKGYYDASLLWGGGSVLPVASVFFNDNKESLFVNAFEGQIIEFNNEENSKVE